MASIFARILPLKHQSINRVLENSCRKLYAIIVNAVNYEHRINLKYGVFMYISLKMVVLKLHFMKLLD